MHTATTTYHFFILLRVFVASQEKFKKASYWESIFFLINTGAKINVFKVLILSLTKFLYTILTATDKRAFAFQRD